MIRSRPLQLFALVLALMVSAPVRADLERDVARAQAAVDLQGASVAISIRDAESDAELVAVQASEPMLPASNMKLLTTGAALHVLGRNFQYATRLLHDGKRLIVLGDGDPAFADPQLLEQMPYGDANGIDVETFVRFWVQPVVDAGFDEVEAVVVDDRIFDRRFVHPTWPVEQLNKRYCAEVAGLSVHLNVLHFFPRPGAGGRPVVSDFRPHAPWLKIGNKATCLTGPRERNSVWISRTRDSSDLTFYGNVKHDHRRPVQVTLHDPPAFFAELLADRLTRAGVEVGRWGVSGDDDPATAGTPVGPAITTPIATVVTRCNRDSQNLYAESLLKRLGHEMTGRPGSWTDGAAIVRHVVYERVGNPAVTNGLIVADGSGLSRSNRISAAAMTAWLNTFHHDDVLGPVLIASLARPGEPGTLQKRFRGADLHGADVRAKSGFINEVSCLSGFVTGADGRRRTFSILVNDLRVPVSLAKQLQERIVEAIASDMATAEVTLGSD